MAEGATGNIASESSAETVDSRTSPVAVWAVLEKLKGDELSAWRTAEVHNRPTPAERNLDLPFAYGWYPVMLSADLAEAEAKAVRAFSTELVIWRGTDGKVRMLDAYCRHLGAHMGHGGKVVGELLECPFHAWRYDGSGIVREIDYARNIPPQVKRPCERQWHITEANRWIWMWYHPAAADPEWEVEHVAEATNPEWTDYDIIEWDVYGSLQNMAENGVDSAHFKYIHGAADVPAYEFEWGDNWRAARLFVKMGTPRGTVDGEIAFKNIGPGQSYTRFTGIAETLLVSCILPIEKDHVKVRFCFTQPKAQAEGRGGGAARAIIKDICKQFDQDKVVWDRQKYLLNALVCDGDGPIAKFRKHYAQFYVTETGEPWQSA
jgi:phenylpropionate dioxygenase-like ring-hydroxylating dioxygenase large terminal subunit